MNNRRLGNEGYFLFICFCFCLFLEYYREGLVGLADDFRAHP